MALIAANVRKEYPTRSGPLPVLADCSLTLEPGRSATILGPSGSGKSTLLHILGTLDRPTAGSVSLHGTDPFALSEPELARFRNRRIGFVFQDHHLLPQCSVLENVLIPTLVDADARPAEVEEYARHLLERVGLSERITHRPAELSGGERQRVAVARALIQKPALVLADEPTGNLDRRTAQSIGELLRDIPREQGAVLVVVTHSAELAQLFDERYEVRGGRLARLSEPEA